MNPRAFVGFMLIVAAFWALVGAGVRGLLGFSTGFDGLSLLALVLALVGAGFVRAGARS